jgi:hypothetical protein
MLLVSFIIFDSSVEKRQSIVIGNTARVTRLLRSTGTNELVQRRLKLVLKAYQAGGFKSRKAEVTGYGPNASSFCLPSNL